MTFRAAECLRAMQSQELRAACYRAFLLAKRDGRITPATSCTACGKTERIEAHHPDYRKPFSVLWLCHRCHVRLHLLGGRIGVTWFPGVAAHQWEYRVRGANGRLGFRNADMDLRGLPARWVA